MNFLRSIYIVLLAIFLLTYTSEPHRLTTDAPEFTPSSIPQHAVPMTVMVPMMVPCIMVPFGSVPQTQNPSVENLVLCTNPSVWHEVKVDGGIFKFKSDNQFVGGQYEFNLNQPYYHNSTILGKIDNGQMEAFFISQLPDSKKVWGHISRLPIQLKACGFFCLQKHNATYNAMGFSNDENVTLWNILREMPHPLKYSPRLPYRLEAEGENLKKNVPTTAAASATTSNTPQTKQPSNHLSYAGKAASAASTAATGAQDPTPAEAARMPKTKSSSAAAVSNPANNQHDTRAGIPLTRQKSTVFGHSRTERVNEPHNLNAPRGNYYGNGKCNSLHQQKTDNRPPRDTKTQKSDTNTRQQALQTHPQQHQTKKSSSTTMATQTDQSGETQPVVFNVLLATSTPLEEERDDDTHDGSISEVDG